jgi:hypothetical protein
VARRVDAGLSRADLAVFLGCGLGNEGETQPVVERTVAMAMGLADGPASPVHFANSVSNSATFQVAQVLGTHGPNAVLSAQEHSFEAALWAAHWTLQARDAPAVLCGGLDEWTEPREGPLARMGRPSSPRQGEGGGWLWLQAGPPGAWEDGLPQPGMIGSPLRLSNPRHREALDHALRHLEPGPEGVLLAGDGVQDADLDPLLRYPLRIHRYLERTGGFPTAGAAAIASALGNPATPPVLHVHLGRGPLGLVATLFRPGGASCG